MCGDITQNTVSTVVGAGSYGTAIAISLAKNGNPVVLWGHNPNHIQDLKLFRSNKVNLPNIFFPVLLRLEESLSVALSHCENVFIAVPSHVFSIVLTQLKFNINNINGIIIASKGLEPNTGKFFENIVHDVLGDNIPCAIISGPTFARELAIGLPTSITLVTNDAKFCNSVQNLLSSIKNLHVSINTDVIGVQIAGAVKNIIAIGVGISDGMGFGSNARIALITHGLSEMSSLGMKIGAKYDTFIGLAGLGDLVLTCTDNQSRNRRFGVLLGSGVNVCNAKKKIGQIIEGIYNVKSVYILSLKYKVRMPITEQVYQILYESKSVKDAAVDLLRNIHSKETVHI